jgi:hypothetical protein
METPNYIKSLLVPTTRKPQGRRVWSIDLEQVWLPFFTATNTMGDTAIPSQAIGCPLRLGYDKTGAVRFTQAGRPVIRVAKEIGDNVRLVRDNFTANLLNYAGSVIREHTEDYKAQVELAKEAGEPIYQHDKNQLASAVKALAEAQAIAQAEAVAKAKAEAVKPESRQRELVTA